MFGGGIASLAGGGVFYYYGQKAGPNEKYVYSDTRLLGGTMVVLGAAAVVTAAVLWVRNPDPTGAPVAVIGSHAGYLGWARSF
jgi:hypothetical protein